MPRFKYRLQRLLDLCANLLDEAERALASATASRVAAEQFADALLAKRKAVALHEAHALEDMKSKELCVLRLAGEEGDARAVVALLADEESVAKAAYFAAKRDVQTLEKLRERKYAEWLYQENRREQNELDDFATMRRQPA